MKIIGPDNRLLSIDEWASQQPIGDTAMRITRLRITDFRSIASLDAAIPAAGLNVAGRNEIGKSNVIRALRAALAGVGVAPDAIREGANACEVLVETDDARLRSIRQRITQSGGTVTITTSDGDKVARPREKLRETFGLSCFDPLAFYNAKPADQRRMVLEAMPVTLTDADVAKWTGEDIGAHGMDLTRNGLEVLAGLHKSYYDLRAAANKDADATAGALRAAQDEAERLAKPEHKGVVVPLPGQEEAPVRAAEKSREALAQRQQQAEAMAKRTEGTRARIVELTAEADKIREAGPMVPPLKDVERARAELAEAEADVKNLEQRLAIAQGVLRVAKANVDKLNQIQNDANECTNREAQKRQQAADLEATLAATTIDPPTAEELAQADAAVAQARAHLELVRAARAAHDATVKVCVLTDEDDAAKAEAARLDRIVKTLANDAPVELAARANLIPGLTLTEDGVLYQGHPIDDSMSGAQRMLVAVQIAKRANAKAGLLLVDEIGVMDDEHMREFVKLCTADGWQLISTCMRNTTDAEGKPTREMVLEAIELDQDQAGEAA